MVCAAEEEVAGVSGGSAKAIQSLRPVKFAPDFGRTEARSCRRIEVGTGRDHEGENY